MALKILSTDAGSAGPAPALPTDWRALVTDTLTRARAAAAAGDVAALEAALAEVAGWDDGHRALQALRAVTDAVLGTTGITAERWIALCAAVARALLDRLERTPAEPLLLNDLGVVLYEITELDGAEAALRAARRLDPTLPHIDGNLAHVRAGRARRERLRVPPAVGAELRRLRARARAVANQARPATGMRLSLCMIVRDEEDMLPGCLAAVRDAVDEIVVVDTGSRDRTREIAAEFGATVVDFPWNGSFADARNASLEHATGDWILQLDADEHVLAEDAPRLRELLGQTWREAFSIVETHYTGGDAGTPSIAHEAHRVFRNRPEYRFEGRVHEQIVHRMPGFVPERFAPSGIRSVHYGYLGSIVSAKEKSRRNLDLLRAEAAESPGPFTDYNLGTEHLSLGDAPEARLHLERAWTAVRGAAGRHGTYVPLLATRLAQACRESGDLAAAERTAREGLEIFPDHTDLVLELALTARAGGDLTAAADLAGRCLEMGDAPARYAAAVGSGSHLALRLLAEVREAAGAHDDAEAIHVRSLREHPHYPAPVLPLVALRLRRGLAVEDALAGVALERPAALELAATALLEAGRAEAAEELLRRVLGREPGNGGARFALVEALLSQRRYADAAAEAAREPEGSPLAGPTALAHGFAAAAAGDPAGARDAVGRAAAAGVPAHDLELLRAWAACLEGAPAPAFLPPACLGTAATALEAFLRVQDVDNFAALLPVFAAVAVDPRERTEVLARMYLRRGFLESAADEWIAVAQSAPDARAFLGLAQVALAHGYDEDALEFAGEALVLDPALPGAARLRDALAARVRRAG